MKIDLTPYGYLDIDNIYQPNISLTHDEIVELNGKPFYTKEQLLDILRQDRTGSEE